MYVIQVSHPGASNFYTDNYEEALERYVKLTEQFEYVELGYFENGIYTVLDQSW